MIDDPVIFNRQRMGVAIIVYDPVRELVLTCERIGCRDMNGLWQFPGGAIESDESHIQAAQRELREETGLFFKLSEFSHTAIGIGRTPDGHPFVTEFFTVEFNSALLEPVNKEPEKHSSWTWCHPDDLCQRGLIPLAAKVLKTKMVK